MLCCFKRLLEALGEFWNVPCVHLLNLLSKSSNEIT